MTITQAVEAGKITPNVQTWRATTLIKTTLWLCFVPLLLFDANAQTRDGVERQTELSSFIENAAHNWQTRWDSDLGVPTSMLNGIYRTQESRQQSPFQASEAFFEATKRFLFSGDESNELVLAQIDTTRAQTYALRYDHYYKGLPVFGSGYVLGIAAEDRTGLKKHDVYFLAGPFHADVDVDIVADVSASQAGQIAIKATGSEDMLVVGTPALVVFPTKESGSWQYRVAYKVVVGNADGSDEVYIDARNGRVLLDMAGSGFATGAHVSGAPTLEGKEEPRKTAESFASPLVPRTTATALVKDYVDPSNVPTSFDVGTMRYIGSGTLQGSYTDMENGVLGGSTASANSGSSFYFTGQGWEFDQANAYFHINNMIYEFGLVPDYHVEVVTRSGDTRALTNSTTPADSYMKLQDANSSSNIRNTSWTSAVAVHEYIHLYTFFGNANLRGATIARAVWEGLSDFFGIAYREEYGSTNTEMGSYADWGGGWARNVDNLASWQDFLDNDGNIDGKAGWDEYDGAMSVSGALWDFYQDGPLSKASAIDLIDYAIGYTGSSPTLTSLGDAMIGSPDCNMLCSDRIYQYWEAHDADVNYTPQSRIGYTDKIDVTSSDIDLVITSYPNPFNPRTQITIDVSNTTKVEAVVFDMLGREVHTVVSGILQKGKNDFSWDASSVPSGQYILRVSLNGQQHSRMLSLIR